jgi:hypothetical protein
VKTDKENQNQKRTGSKKQAGHRKSLTSSSLKTGGKKLGQGVGMMKWPGKFN